MRRTETPRRTRVALFAGAACFLTFSVDAVEESPLMRALHEPWPKITVVDGIEIVPVRDNVYMLVVDGANVTVLLGEEVVIVDSGPVAAAGRLVAAVQHLTQKPIRALINTSSDPDHVGGNIEIVKAAGGLAAPEGNSDEPEMWNVGTYTFSHENVANRMALGSKGSAPLPTDAVPGGTFFTARRDIYMSGEGILLLWQPGAITDGDIFVHFRASDVVSVGDVLRTDSYPRIDPDLGGSLQGEIDALTTLLEITIPQRNQIGGTLVVPGHGRIVNEADIVEYRDMLTILRDRVKRMIEEGMTLAQIWAARPSLEYDGLYGKYKEWTGDMFLESIYRDLVRTANDNEAPVR